MLLSKKTFSLKFVFPTVFLCGTVGALFFPATQLYAVENAVWLSGRAENHGLDSSCGADKAVFQLIAKDSNEVQISVPSISIGAMRNGVYQSGPAVDTSMTGPICLDPYTEALIVRGNGGTDYYNWDNGGLVFINPGPEFLGKKYLSHLHFRERNQGYDYKHVSPINLSWINYDPMYDVELRSFPEVDGALWTNDITYTYNLYNYTTANYIGSQTKTYNGGVPGTYSLPKLGLTEGMYAWYFVIGLSGLISANSGFEVFMVDLTPPIVSSVHAPAVNLTETVPVTISAEAQDVFSGLSSMEIYIDGVRSKTCSFSGSTGINTCSSSPLAFPPGTHSYYTIAHDRAGNSTQSSVSNFTIPSTSGSCTGETWTPRSAAGNNDNWFDVTYGNGMFVAVGYAGDRVMTSPDGITWTPRSAAGNNDNWFDVTYGNGMFVAVGYAGDRVMTSPDGITWTPRSAAGDNDSWRGVTYGNGLFVAVGYAGDRVMTSPDGITWTPRSAAGNNDNWFDVTYGNGMFVAVGYAGDPVMTSSCSTVLLCSATTENYCTLPATPSGSSAGSCQAPSTGTCAYTCTNGVWSENANACTSAGIVAQNCDIPAGSDTCGAQVSWNTSGFTPSVRQDGTEFSTNASFMNAMRTILYGTHTFSIYDGSTLKTSDTATASCAPGTVWNVTSNTCVATVLSVRATPRVVNVGDSINLIWTLNGNTNCSITKNGQTILSGLNTDGSDSTQTIQSRTTYMLTCGAQSVWTQVEVQGYGTES